MLGAVTFRCLNQSRALEKRPNNQDQAFFPTTRNKASQQKNTPIPRLLHQQLEPETVVRQRKYRQEEVSTPYNLAIMLLSNRVSVLCLVAALVATANAGFWGDSEASNNEPSEPKQPDEPVEYGVDVSFPIHHEDISTNYDWLPHNVDTTIQTPRQYQDMVRQPLGNRREFYDKFLDSCVKHFGRKGQRCVANEADRIAMSLRQPQSMQNYTAVGFKKIKAPEEVFKLIKDFWDRNNDKAKPENWGVGNTYTNNWDSPSKMVSVEDSALRGGGRGLKQKIWNAARNVIQGTRRSCSRVSFHH